MQYVDRGTSNLWKYNFTIYGTRLTLGNMLMIIPTNKQVRRKGPKWFTCMPSNSPSSVSFCVTLAAPALLISTSRCGSVSIILLANFRTEARELRSRCCTSTFVFPVWAIISSVITREKQRKIRKFRDNLYLRILYRFLTLQP